MKNTLRLSAIGVAVLILSGCASVNFDTAIQETNTAVQGFTQGKLELSRTSEQRQAREALSAQLLAKPLTMDDAVQVALANSPAMQALLAQSWADMAAAEQSGRIANPVFTFERMRFKDELELGRLLSIGRICPLFPVLAELVATRHRRAFHPTGERRCSKIFRQLVTRPAATLSNPARFATAPSATTPSGSHTRIAVSVKA